MLTLPALCLLLAAGSATADAPAKAPIIRDVRDVEGWKVHVDRRLLNDDAELGMRALRVLAYKLNEIKQLMPADRLEKLQKVGIALDRDCPGLTSMQYHPSLGWLKEHGHDPTLAKMVHIPRASELVSRLPVNQQPMVVLHELAHAYHDQVLGFDEPRIKAAWARFKESGKFEQTLHIAGRTQKHYGLTNQMEFFAEMTEAFFGTNDFYPFVRGELKKELPELDKLLEEIWLAKASAAAVKPVKVYLLAGQSNMQGHGHVRTLDWLGQDPKHGHLLKKLKKDDGSWAERDDVWMYYKSDGPPRKGNLSVGYGVSKDHIGPELMFGQVMGDHHEAQVLLVKVAWGGRSLAVNFRPPSAGPLPLASYPEAQQKRLEESIQNGKLKVGAEYRLMVAELRDMLANLKTHFPAYAGQGYEIAGFVWFQGWNDMIDAAFTAEYAKNLQHLVKDLRKDLELPNLPVVIAEMGVSGNKPSAGIERFRKAQAEGVALAEFKGNVALVPTADLWDEQAQALLDKGWKNNKWTSKESEEEFNKMGSQPPYHYLGSAKIQCLIGRQLAEALKGTEKSTR